MHATTTSAPVSSFNTAILTAAILDVLRIIFRRKPITTGW
jgi:hypothetical protein